MFLFHEVKKTHYETLGIKKNAGEDEIKRAYFGLVRKYQPDRFPEEFKEIRAAYETLSDRKKRADYDAVGELPPSVAATFHEAQRLDRFGRHGKAAELYRMILKKHPKLDKVREQYALSLAMDDKPGKAAEAWEELCRRHPDNPSYARELGESYFDRGWNKKALAETRRALDLDSTSIDAWLLLISCATEGLKNISGIWDEIRALSAEALEAVKTVKTDEWKKIQLHAHAFVTAGIENIDGARDNLREIVRLIRECGQKGQEVGALAFGQIVSLVPPESLAKLYPELKEVADLLSNRLDEAFLEKLEDIRLSLQIESLVEKGFSEIFRDLFRILNADFEEEEEDELEVTAIEYHLLDDKKTYDPQIRRLKEEFPELYAFHGSFFNEALRTRNPEKMLYQRSKKYRKLKRRVDFDDDDEEPDPEPAETVRRAQPKVGRNDPCPCGSGKKYKHCHGR
ncbi:MAG: DnaJ domain-containing protein [Treponema sp.]|nr:DnaJ domain-containing protein [Treponema sp.]